MAQCTAKSKRSTEQCQKWAVRGSTTCHMHGGTSRGPKTKAGKERSRLAALKHGGHTKKAKAQHSETMMLIRRSKDLLQSLSFGT
ncbi:MAG: HGGxSTG domain-containing protein [Parachlamydiales bacterium]